jgi:hypothetical protein
MRTDHGQTPGSGRSLRRWRTAALLATGIAIGVAMTATPVSAHIGTSVTHLWNAHIKPLTDARYYTKTQANTRYYTRAQANARYLGANAKAADADELDGLDSTAFLPATGKAADADALDGLDSTAFLRSNGKAADAELLDGLDSAAFFRGNGRAIGGARSMPVGMTPVFLTIPDVVRLAYVCLPPEAPNGGAGRLQILNDGGETMHLFVESGEANPTYRLALPDSVTSFLASAAGDSFHIQAQASWGVLTIEVATVNFGSSCLAQAQAVLTR